MLKTSKSAYNYVRGDALVKTFNVVIHPCKEGGYWAEIPDVGYCNTQGETLQEVEANMYEAVELCLEDLPDISEYSLVFEVRDA